MSPEARELLQTIHDDPAQSYKTHEPLKDLPHLKELIVQGFMRLKTAVRPVTGRPFSIYIITNAGKDEIASLS